VQKRVVLLSPEEKNAQGWSTKEGLPKVKIEQEGEGSYGKPAKNFGEGLDARRK